MPLHLHLIVCFDWQVWTRTKDIHQVLVDFNSKHDYFTFHFDYFKTFDISKLFPKIILFVRRSSKLHAMKSFMLCYFDAFIVECWNWFRDIADNAHFSIQWHNAFIAFHNVFEGKVTCKIVTKMDEPWLVDYEVRKVPNSYLTLKFVI